jgi:hypothetical protein
VGCLHRTPDRAVVDAVRVLSDWVTLHTPFATE